MRASAPAPHCIGSCLGVGPTEVGEDVAELRGGDEAVAVAIEDLPFEGAVRSGACGRRRVCLFLVLHLERLEDLVLWFCFLHPGCHYRQKFGKIDFPCRFWI